MKIISSFATILLIAFAFSPQLISKESNRWTTNEQREAFASKVMGYDTCTQCHKFSVQAWKKSKHFKSLESLNLDKDGKGKAIMKAMGLDGSPAAQASCAQCHFTDQSTKDVNQFTGKKFGPIVGVSCESCHGAAADWTEIHNKKSLKDIKDKFATLKNDAQKKEFLKAVHLSSIDDKVSGEFTQWRNDITAKSGMIRPDMIYNLINNCYECHTIGQKDLINKTAELDEPHAAGSEFEIVSWLSGEVKHNFKNADPDNPKNKPFTKEEKRTLFVAGKILFAEHALRALAKASFPKSEEEDPTRFYEEMKARTEIGLGEIAEINETLEGKVPEIKTVAEKVAGFVKKLGNDKLSAADLSAKNFDGQSIADYLEAMNKKFISASGKNTALSKLDSAYINDLEPQGTVYK